MTYELVRGIPPFYGSKESDIFEKISKCKASTCTIGWFHHFSVCTYRSGFHWWFLQVWRICLGSWLPRICPSVLATLKVEWQTSRIMYGLILSTGELWNTGRYCTTCCATAYKYYCKKSSHLNTISNVIYVCFGVAPVMVAITEKTLMFAVNELWVVAEFKIYYS